MATEFTRQIIEKAIAEWRRKNHYPTDCAACGSGTPKIMNYICPACRLDQALADSEGVNYENRANWVLTELYFELIKE